MITQNQTKQICTEFKKKGPGGDAYDGFVYFLFIIFFIVAACEFMQPKQKNNTHTIDCKTKVEPKI